MSQRQLGVASPACIIWTQCLGPSRASAMPGTLDQSADHARQESTRMRRGKANVKPVPLILQLAPAPKSVSVMRASNLAAALALHVLQARALCALCRRVAPAFVFTALATSLIPVVAFIIICSTANTTKHVPLISKYHFSSDCTYTHVAFDYTCIRLCVSVCASPSCYLYLHSLSSVV